MSVNLQACSAEDSAAGVSRRQADRLEPCGTLISTASHAAKSEGSVVGVRRPIRRWSLMLGE